MATKHKPKVSMVTIQVPFGDKAFGYEQSQAEGGQVPIGGRDRLQVNAQLGPDAATAFLKIRNGLRESQARLSDGRQVWGNHMKPSTTMTEVLCRDEGERHCQVKARLGTKIAGDELSSTSL